MAMKMSRKQLAHTKKQLAAFGGSIGPSNLRERSKSRDAAKLEKHQGRNALFDAMCEAHGVPVPVHEYRFHPERKWRFDYCWPSADLALEVQGGIWTGGHHVRGADVLDDHEKLVEAVVLGWTVIYCTPDDVNKGTIFVSLKRILGELL